MNRPVEIPHRLVLHAPVATCVALLLALGSSAAAPCDLSEFEIRFHEIVTNVQPSVVSVIAYSRTDATVSGSSDSLESLTQNVGSGVVIDIEGHVLTTHSVVEESRTLFVRTHSGSMHPAVFIGDHPETDLALLQVTETRIPAAPLGLSSTLEAGDWLITVGQPHGEYPDRSFGSYLRGAGDEELIHTTAPAFPGQTGGAVINVRGEVVALLLGQVSAEAANAVTAQNSVPAAASSAAIPMDRARRVAAELVDHGSISPAYLGLKVRMPTEELKGLLKFDNGVLVEEVVAGSPAEASSIEAGDVILSFDGAPVREPASLVRIVSAKSPGDHCQTLILRGDVKLTRSVTLSVVPELLRQQALAQRQANMPSPLTDAQLNARILQLQQELEQLQQLISN